MATSNQTPAGKYILATYNTQSKTSPLPCSDQEFLESVEAEVLLLDPNVNLETFFTAIDLALATDRKLASAGLTSTAFKDSPERVILKKAIDNAIDDQRLPRGSKRVHQALSAADELSSPDLDPVSWAIVAERAAAVQEAMKAVTDPMDRKILKLLFFDPSCKNQAQVARKIGRSDKFVSRRLEGIYELLRGPLEYLNRS